MREPAATCGGHEVVADWNAARRWPSFTRCVNGWPCRSAVRHAETRRPDLLKVAQGSTLSGQVRRLAAKVLFENGEMTAAGGTPVTTPTGLYRFEGLELSEARLVASYPGSEACQRPVRVIEGGNTHNIDTTPMDPVQSRAGR